MGTVTIPLTQGKAALIDEEDYPLVRQYTWCADRRGTRWYGRAYNPTTKRFMYLHRLILDPPADVRIDHKDFDGLNCTRANMRSATATQNNAYKRSMGKDGYKGIRRNRKR